MLKTIKESATIAGWLTLGATAIVVQTAYKGVKQIKTELDNDMPQELVRYHCQNIRNSVNNMRRTNDTNIEPVT
jgi:hypothetical protein